MLSIVSRSALHSFMVLLSRGISSRGSSPSRVSRPVVLLEDIRSNRTHESGLDFDSDSEKDTSSRAGAKHCSRNCRNCPLSAAHSKLKSENVGQLHAPAVGQEGESSVHGPASLEDCSVSPVGRATGVRFRTK